jgi:hypothetical protein
LVESFLLVGAQLEHVAVPRTFHYSPLHSGAVAVHFVRGVYESGRHADKA